LTGVFAFVFTLIGFRFFSLSLTPAIITATLFTGMTWSTMVWNDLIDRERDLKKGKTLASIHPYLVFKIWWQINKITGLLLITSYFISWQLGIFCTSVWFIAIWYSVLKLKYPFNNLLVAFCSASPVLAGMIYAGTFNWNASLVFFIVFSTITIMELVKDMQDMEGDVGYKDTLPVQKGIFTSVIVALSLCWLPIMGTIAYPDKATICSVIVFLPIVWSLCLSIKARKAIFMAENWGDLFIASLLITILIIQ
jgi:4-hydroxybenzoate polyprenyltransferase